MTRSSTDPSAGEPVGPLCGYEVVVCVCGGIAAYKVATLVSRLVQRGCGVTVAMTRSARRFVGRATFVALSGRPVASSLWRVADIPHLATAQTADLVVVAPATANIIGKLAGGIADDLVSTLLIGAACPVMMAPAMNARMWQHPAVQHNAAVLSERGVIVVGPESGWQACREVGPGRMVEPEMLLERVEAQLKSAPPRQVPGN